MSDSDSIHNSQGGVNPDLLKDDLLKKPKTKPAQKQPSTSGSKPHQQPQAQPKPQQQHHQAKPQEKQPNVPEVVSDGYYEDYYEDEQPAPVQDNQPLVLTETVRNQRAFMESQAQQIKDLQAAMYEQQNQHQAELAIVNEQLTRQKEDAMRKEQQMQKYNDELMDVKRKTVIPAAPADVLLKLSEQKLLQLTGQAGDQIIQFISAAPQLLMQKVQKILQLEQDLAKKNDEIRQYQKQFQDQMGDVAVKMQAEIQAKQRQIQQLNDKIAADSKMVSESQQTILQAKLEVSRAESKYHELEDFCIQQQDMIQVLEIENLVALSQIDGSKPMDIVEAAIADSVQWIRADKKAANYSRKFVETKRKKERLEAGEELEPKQALKSKTVKLDKEVPAPKGGEKLFSPKPFKYVPVPPEPEIAEKVKEAKTRMSDQGVELSLVWKRVESQKEIENQWAWHLENKQLNLTVLRGKLMIKVGAGMIDLIEYLAKYLE